MPAVGSRSAPAPAPAPPTAPADPARYPNTVPGGRSKARHRRRHHLGFALFSGVLVGSIVFGIVVLSALLAQTSFRIDQEERRLEELSQENLELVREHATLSAPGRIAAWATRHGMRLPDDIRILHAPGVGSADPAGADTTASQPTAEEPEG
jgi:cell division protein FtsL